MQLVPVLFIISLVVFAIMHVLPGDPAELMLAGAEGGAITPERLAELKEQMGLNDPLAVQYLRFLGGALIGDLGKSIRFRAPVTELILDRFGSTIALAVGGLALSARDRPAARHAGGRAAELLDRHRSQWALPMSARRCRSTGSASCSSCSSRSSSAGSRLRARMAGGRSCCRP